MKKRTIEDFLFEDFQSIKRISFYVIQNLLETAYQEFLRDGEYDFAELHRELFELEQKMKKAHERRRTR